MNVVLHFVLLLYLTSLSLQRALRPATDKIKFRKANHLRHRQIRKSTNLRRQYEDGEKVLCGPVPFPELSCEEPIPTSSTCAPFTGDLQDLRARLAHEVTCYTENTPYTATAAITTDYARYTIGTTNTENTFNSIYPTDTTNTENAFNAIYTIDTTNTANTENTANAANTEHTANYVSKKAYYTTNTVANYENGRKAKRPAPRFWPKASKTKRTRTTTTATKITTTVKRHLRTRKFRNMPLRNDIGRTSSTMAYFEGNGKVGDAICDNIANCEVHTWKLRRAVANDERSSPS